MNTDFNILEKNIEQFNRKFLWYKSLRGFLVILISFVTFLLIINLIEYKLFMSSVWRQIIFISGLLFFTLVTLRFVIYPLVLISGVVKKTNKKNVARIILNYIPDIKDKLLNVIELHELNDGFYSRELISASVTQKINELKVFDFSGSLDLKGIKSLFFYFIASFLVIAGIIFFNSSLITEPGNRLIHFRQEFIKPAPFKFELLNGDLMVRKGNGITIRVKCEGEKIPSILYINIEGNEFIMKKEDVHLFEYEFSSLMKSVEFNFTDLQYSSKEYKIEIIPVPVINKFTAIVQYPAYTGIKNKIYENIADIEIIKGSKVQYDFHCFDADSLRMAEMQGKVLNSITKSANHYKINVTHLKSTTYEVEINNKKTPFEKIMKLRVNVVEDNFPEIKVIQTVDSTKLTRFYFSGNIQDDFGFTSLNFKTRTETSDSTIQIPVVKSVANQEFYYSIDFNEFKTKGRKIDYFFTVSDNDIISGPKITTSDTYSFIFPDEEEVKEIKEDNFNKMEDIFRESNRIASEIKKELKDLQLKNMANSLSEWEKNQIINNIQSNKLELENILKEIENKYKKNTNFENTFSENKEEIIKKQEQIQDLLDQIMTDELKKLFEEFNKLAEEFNSKKLNEIGKNMDLSIDDLSKQLEKNLELLKKLKIEQGLEKIIDRVKEEEIDQNQKAEEILKLEDLAEKSDSMAEDLNEIENIQHDLEKILEENEELSNPVLFDGFKDEFDAIKENIKETAGELKKKNRKNSANKMKKTSEMLGELGFKMRQMLDFSKDSEKKENITDLKQILKNLLNLSFEQEKILTGISSSLHIDPVIRKYVRDQKDLMDKSVGIKDSLYALAERSPEVGNLVNNELLTMELNLNRSTELLREGMFSQASTNQRLVLTSANNLTLMLSEILGNMEEKEGSMDGDGNEGGKTGTKGKMGSMKKMSDNLSNQLQKMIEEMKKGDGKNMGKQLGESLMMYEMMQSMLREILNSGEIGNNTRKQLMEIDRLLDISRRDIMNKRVTPEIVLRHNQITTRMLEAEKSEMERDEDNKRESETAEEKFYSRPATFFEEKQPLNISLENLYLNKLKLNNFYQNKFKNYVEKINTIPENGN